MQWLGEKINIISLTKTKIYREEDDTASYTKKVKAIKREYMMRLKLRELEIKL